MMHPDLPDTQERINKSRRQIAGIHRILALANRRLARSSSRMTEEELMELTELAIRIRTVGDLLQSELREIDEIKGDLECLCRE